MFFEAFANPDDCQKMVVENNAECMSRLISEVDADCHDMPIASPISPCSSDESADDVMNITGNYSNIQNKYHIDPRVLGQGCQGSARECIDRATGQRFAVKTIRKSDPTFKPDSVAREIMLLKHMKHQSIVQLVDVYEDAQYVHMVTDLCEGGELFDRIVERSSNRENGSACFAEDETAGVMHQLLTAVSYMHRQGVVHRDIKPENILLESNAEDSPIKIIDFGLSAKHCEGFEPPMSKIVGTPYYIAPEVLRKNYNKSCDLWSVGVLTYILLGGYPPFNGANNTDIVKSILGGKYSFPSEEWKDVSQEAQDFISRLLQTDTSKRMTVEDALNHPWIVRYNNTDVLMRSDISEEAMAKGLSVQRRSVMFSGRRRRNLRIAMFGK